MADVVGMPPLENLSPHEAEIVKARWFGDPFIEVPEEYSLETEATAFFKAADCQNSPYFPKIDFYHSYSHGSLSMLPCFRTYQQTRGHTCASAVALMTLCHFGNYDWHELEISDKMASFHGLPPGTRRPTPVGDLLRFFRSIGWETESNLPCAARYPVSGEREYNPWAAERAKTFPRLEDFAAYCKKMLRAGIPIMVENIDWGAHWRAIVGYDDMGSDNPLHGVLIIVDPHDTADHCQDGFVIEHIDKFYCTWYDVFVMELTECTQPFVAAWPPDWKGGFDHKQR